VLAHWSGWGAAPAVFDDQREEFGQQRAELQQLLTDAEYRAAARTTLNAHYTDAALVAAIWGELAESGFAQTAGQVLEPGCGSGTFLGYAPATPVCLGRVIPVGTRRSGTRPAHALSADP